MKELFGNSYLLTSRNNWNESTVSIMNCWAVGLHVLTTLLAVWGGLSDIMNCCFGMNYLIPLRIVCNR